MRKTLKDNLYYRKIRSQINTPKLWINKFPWKKKSDHKYSRGRVVVYGGEKHMVGATILSSESALRVGTGSVKIICDKKNILIYSSKFPSLLKVEINSFNLLKKFLEREKITSMLIGPGAGSSRKTKKIVKMILSKVKNVVLDADALTCFKTKPKELYALLDKNKIITPHLKEFHSIFPNISKKEDPIKKVLEAAKLTKSNVLLKGSKTILGSYDKKIIINSHSSPELATIGSGDVLSGILVSLIGEKKMNPFLAACSAVWLHGDIAKNYGKGLIAEDIVKGIPQALTRLEKWKIY